MVTLLFQDVSSQEKHFLFTKKSCCSGTAPTTQIPQLNSEHWQKTLREAAYQSIMRHVDFMGTLDDRLNRDHELWTKIKQARFKEQFQPYTDDSNEVRSGILIERKRRNGQYEFRQSDKRIYDCSDSTCKSNNNSLVALWRVRKTQDPYGLWIRVKLPHSYQEQPIEDVYEYNVKYGLKHLNSKTEPNPTTKQLLHERNIKMMDRIDVRFPDDVQELLRIKPIINQAYSKHYPTTSQRNLINYAPKESTKHHADVGTVIATGPEGYRHIIHSLGKIPLAGIIQPIYDSFLPSIGPQHEPAHMVRYHPVYMNIPVYTTSNDFNPQFINVYRQALDNFFGKKHTVSQVTQKPIRFKPSTEYVQYSEMDPLYHSTSDSDMRTSPMPEIRQPLTSSFPDSINAQLPPTVGDVQSGNTKNTTPRPRFQIVVSEYNKPSSLVTKDDAQNDDNTRSPVDTEYESISEINKFFPVYEIRKQTTKKYNLENKNDNQSETTTNYGSTMKSIQSEQHLTTKGTKQATASTKIGLVNTHKDSTATASEQTHFTTQSYDKTEPSLFSSDVLLNSTLDIIKNMKEIEANEDVHTIMAETVTTDTNYEMTNDDKGISTVATEEFTTTKYFSETTMEDDTTTTDRGITDTTENNFASFFSSLTETLFQPTTQAKESLPNRTSILNSTHDIIMEKENGNQQTKRSSSPVTIVENRISQSITYKTSKGTTGSLTNNKESNKQPTQQMQNTQLKNSSWPPSLHNFGLNSILGYLATPAVTTNNKTNTSNQNVLL